MRFGWIHYSLNTIADLMPPALLGKEILWFAISSSKMNSRRQKRQYSDRTVESVIVGPDVDPRIDPLRWYKRWKTMRDSKAVALFHRADNRVAVSWQPHPSIILLRTDWRR